MDKFISSEEKVIALIDLQNALLEKNITVIERLAECLDGSTPEWIDRTQASNILGVHPTTFDRRRRDWIKQGYWLENVHWKKIDGQHPVFNALLMKDLRHNPIESIEHLNLIRQWKRNK